MRIVFFPKISFVCLILLAAATLVLTQVACRPGDPQATSSTQSNSPHRAATPDEAAVFAALDFSRPELAAVRTAVESGDYTAASSVWAKYLRERKGYTWGGPNTPLPRTYNKTIAENALIGKVQGGYVPLIHAFPEGKIDWLYNATEHTPGQEPNAEWQYQLNRMQFWVEMARAYVATGDERYPQVFAKQLHSWMDQCPVPATVQNVKGSPWRTIEAGIRFGYNWPYSFLLFLPSPSLSDADIMAFTKATLDHGRYLRKNQTSVNWVLMEMNGLAVAGCFFPEFREASDWRAFAIARTVEECHRQILPDGGQIELTSGYHDDVVIPNIIGISNAAQWTGHARELPESYLAVLERAYDWSMYLSAPNGDRPKINDAWPGSIRSTLKNAVQLFPNRSDFRWFTADQTEGQPPDKTSVFLDWSGLAVMRSSWDRDANYLLFDVGPLGYGGHMGNGHSHQDKLNVVIWAYGRELLFDGGGSSYVWDKWRVWSQSSLSHNCILVDGFGQNRAGPNSEKNPSRISQEPINASWQSTPIFDFASGIYDEEYGTAGYSSESNRVEGIYDPKIGPVRKKIATQWRAVLFLKPDIYIVADRMTPLDAAEHRYEARWQLLTTQTALDSATLSVTTQDEGKPNLSIIPLFATGLEVRAASAEESPEILGWHCRKDMVPQNVPATTVLQSRKGTGTQIFLTLLLPLKTGEKNPVRHVRQTGSTADALLSDGRHIEVTFTTDNTLSVREILPDGKVNRSATSRGQ